MLGICRAIGEIDIATAPAFDADLRATMDASDELVLRVDCSAMTFIDSSGYHVLADVNGYALRHGTAMVIQNASPQSARLLRLCDLAHELRLED